MRIIKRTLALLLTLVIISTAAIITTGAVTDTTTEAAATEGITVYCESTSGTPTVYYWNSLPQNIETSYPGPQMTKVPNEAGGNWYSYTFNNVSKINVMFVINGKQTKEFTATNNYWYHADGSWKTYNKYATDSTERTDFREESVYFIITTRFFDGDTGNNVHCWDDKKANNPDSDPAWRGDFQGLIDKLDYIKALGFSAIWITPVVTNASGYDYHGYHAFDFSTVDVRYESQGAKYEDLIKAIHDKDMKVVQDVVWNHTSNFGENFLAKMFTKEYSTVQDLADTSSMKVVEGSDLDKTYPDYDTMNGDPQFQARLNIMKDLKNGNHDPDNYYHREQNMGYESSIEQQGSMAGDCVDINTENPVVASYITDTYLDYANMGVDAFRLDTEKHVNRWTLNSAYFPAFSKIDNFYIFGEVCSRVRETWNHNIPSSSPAFFTWKETESAWQSNWNTSDPTANIATSIKHYDAHRDPSSCPTSTNAFLNGNEYHTPDYSQSNGTGVIDFTMHWNFENASSAFRAGLAEDQYINDSTWNVMYVDSHDYGPDGMEKTRYSQGTQAWAENLNLIFTFRGIPCLFYGTEVEFQKDQLIDVGPNQPLSTTGRAYFGDYLEGNVSASDFGTYTASGKVSETLNSTLSQHIIKLNQIRRAVPALQKGQYSVTNVSGNMCYKRGYTDAKTGEKSFACVAVTNGATFSSIPNGTYIDAVTGDTKNVSNGTLTVSAPGKGNMRVYVLSSSGYTGISGKIGNTTSYMK